MTDNAGNRKSSKETQFKKGVSGNPRGRPRKSGKVDSDEWHSLTKILNQALIQEIEVREGGRIIKIPVIKLIVNKGLKIAAENGDVKLLDQTMKLAEKLDRAALQGLTQEPLVIRVIGGLPDHSPPVPPSDDDSEDA